MRANARHRIFQILVGLTLAQTTACQSSEDSCKTPEEIVFPENFTATQTVRLAWARRPDSFETLLAVLQRKDSDFKVSIVDSVFLEPIANFHLHGDMLVNGWVGFQNASITQGTLTQMAGTMRSFYSAKHASCNGNLNRFKQAGIDFFVTEMIVRPECIFPKTVDLHFSGQSDFKVTVATRELSCQL